MQNQKIAYQQNRNKQTNGQIGVGERYQPQLPTAAAVLGYIGNVGAQNPLSPNPKERYLMDHKTLIYITNGLDEQKKDTGPKLYNPKTTPGLCYECEGDHWVKDCANLKPKLKPVPKIPPLMRCGIKHLVKDCPKIQKKQGIVTINCVKALPSLVPLNAITRAQQAKNDAMKENERKKDT